MKILFCIESLHAGGKERQLIELLTYLKMKQGYELFLVIMKRGIHYDKFFFLNIPYEIIERKFSKKDPFVFYKFYKTYKKFRPDIVHSWGSMVTFYSLPSKFLLNFKLINFQIQNAPQSSMPLFSFDNIITKINFLFSDFIVANSLAGLKSYHIKNDRSKVIYNGIELERFKNLTSPEEIKSRYNLETKYVVTMVARYSKFKKNKLFIDVANYICDKRKDITFLSLGDGDKDLFNQCKNEIKHHNNIILLGSIKDVESIINVCDIGVLFTNGEGISNSILETMALAKPVIAHEIGGTKELIVDGTSGVLLKNDNVNEIANYILDLIEQPEKRKKMGLFAKNFVYENFTIKKMGMEFEILFKNILPNKFK